MCEGKGRRLLRKWFCAQTWAHPKFGDRLDVGMVRQIEDGIDALEVWPSSALLLISHLPCLPVSEAAVSDVTPVYLLKWSQVGIWGTVEGCHDRERVMGLRRSSKARSQSCHGSLGGRR